MAINNTGAVAIDAQYQPTSEEMVLDTADFDIFSSLDDLVEEKATSQEKGTQEDDVAQMVLEDEATEDDDDGSFDFEKIDDDDLEEEDRKPREETEDEIEDEYDEEAEEEDSEEEEELEEEYDDDEEVDYETYEITLPDGDMITLQDAIKGYRSNEAIMEERNNFEAAKNAFKAEAGNTISHLRLAKLEADRVIDDYVDFDWAELSRKDPQSYVENREFLDKYRARKLEIMSAMEEVEQDAESARQGEFQQQAQSCLTELKSGVPGWNDSLYQDLMQYAVDNGTPEDNIASCVDPFVFKVLHKARQFDLGKQVVKAKIKRKVGSPKKVAKSTGRNNSKTTLTDRDKIANKLASGNTSDSDIFDALED